MELDSALAKETSRIPRKTERPYDTSLKPYAMERRRPLRTYSRRTSSVESTEPAPKRRCTGSSPIAAYGVGAPSLTPSESRCSVMASAGPCLPLPMRKGTITAYFEKIISQSPIITPSSERLSDSAEPTITPPLSPPIITKRIKRVRRLKTRVETRQMDEKATSDEDEERHEDKERPGDSNDVAPPAQVCTPALLETTPNIRNQTENILGTHLKGSKRQEDGSQCRKIAAVQTTLNLSMNETVYTECKECDMLYNHLDKTDVKHHARHHAALVRAKARAGAKNNAAE